MYRFSTLTICALVGCQFPRPEPDPSIDPDASITADSAVAVDAAIDWPLPITVTCEDFKRIQDSRYYLFTNVVNKGTATAWCNSIPGSHLVTFETLEEIIHVVGDYPITAKIWTGIKQSPVFGSGVGDRWANQIGTTRTDLPANFPWKSGQPDDGGGFILEDNTEDECALGSDGKFDDVHHTRNMFQVLCECADVP